MFLFRAFRTSFILCLALLSIPTYGQGMLKDYSFVRPNQHRDKLSFELIHNLILVPVTLNGTEGFTFILDTGVEANILTEPPEGDSLILKISKTYTVTGLGDGDPVQAVHTWDNTIRIGDAKAHNQDLLVLMENVFFLSQTLGTSVQGLIGYYFFNSFDVYFRFTSQVLRIREEARAKYRSGYTKIPIRIVDRKPYIEIMLEQPDGTKHTKWVLLDLGASHPLSLYGFRDPELGLQGRYIEAFLGKGLSGEIHGKLSRITAVELGPFRMMGPIVAYPDSQAVAKNTRSAFHVGSIGTGLLRRFHTIISYQDSAIYLKPNRYFKGPFHYNTSGVEVIAPYPNIPLYVVDYVRPDSPADVAGIKQGDQVVWIDGDSTTKMTISEVNNAFREEAGKTIRLDVVREGERISFRFKLKDAL